MNENVSRAATMARWSSEVPAEPPKVAISQSYGAKCPHALSENSRLF